MRQQKYQEMKQKVLLFEIRLEILFLTFRMQHRAPMVLGACDDGILHFRVLLQGDTARTRKPGEKLKNVFRSHSVSSSSDFRTSYPQLAHSLILVNQWHHPLLRRRQQPQKSDTNVYDQKLNTSVQRSKIRHQRPEIQDRTLLSRIQNQPLHFRI